MAIRGAGIVGLGVDLLRRMLAASVEWQTICGRAEVEPDAVIYAFRAYDADAEEADPPRAMVNLGDGFNRQQVAQTTYVEQGNELALALEFVPTEPGRMWDEGYWDEGYWDEGYWDDEQVADDDARQQQRNEEQRYGNQVGRIMAEIEALSGQDQDPPAPTTYLNVADWRFDVPPCRLTPSKRGAGGVFSCGVVVRVK